jgi:hypothetical protein
MESLRVWMRTPQASFDLCGDRLSLIFCSAGLQGWNGVDPCCGPHRYVGPELHADSVAMCCFIPRYSTVQASFQTDYLEISAPNIIRKGDRTAQKYRFLRPNSGLAISDSAYIVQFPPIPRLKYDKILNSGPPGE